MKTETMFGAEAREKLRKGVEKTYNAIAPTLGPKGRSAILSYGKLRPSVTLDDGVSIANFLVLEDPFENEGTKLIKEVASKTNDNVGDSTTTSTVLTWSMLDNAVKNITSGANPTLVKKGIQEAVKFVVNEVTTRALPVTSFEDTKKVATISANDEEMGKKVAEAIEAVKGGLVSVEEGTEEGINIEVVDGMQLGTGYASPYFGIKSSNGVCTLKNAYVAILDRSVSNLEELMPVLQRAKESGRSILLICDNISGSALQLLVKNYVEDRIDVCVVKSPSGGLNKKELLEDVAIYTGGKVFGGVFGDDLKNFDPKVLGVADVITVDSQYTVIRSKPNKEAIDARVETIDNALIKEKNDQYRVEHLRLRRAGLTSGIALIKICEKTTTETKARMAKLEDAKNAALTALKGGVVAGGGTALMSIEPVLGRYIESKRETLDRDIIVGMQVVQQALSKPLEVIASNCGLNGPTVVDKVRENIKDKPTFGFNADTEEYCDMLQTGIIDAANSTKTSLENAASVVSTIIMTECVSVIFDNEEEK